MSKPNPGPWSYENVPDPTVQSAYGHVVDADGKILFDTINAGVGEIHEGYDDVGVHRWDAVAEANLTLAAAAPDLLAACELAAEFLTTVPEIPNYEGAAAGVAERLFAAIAKAKGEPC